MRSFASIKVSLSNSLHIGNDFKLSKGHESVLRGGRVIYPCITTIILIWAMFVYSLKTKLFGSTLLDVLWIFSLFKFSTLNDFQIKFLFSWNEAVLTQKRALWAVLAFFVIKRVDAYSCSAVFLAIVMKTLL